MKRNIYMLLLIFSISILNLPAQTEIIVETTDDLIEVVANASSGDILILQPGIHKNNSDYIEINKSITIKGAEGMAKPKLYFERFELFGENITVNIEGLELSGADVDSITGIEDTINLVSEYFISLHPDLISFGEINVTNCVIRNLLVSVIRGDRAAYTGDGITFDGCVMYDVRDYYDNAYGPFRFNKNHKIASFTLKNSTIFNVVNRILDFENITGIHQDIEVDNCTFYNFGGKTDNRYLFDFKANDDLNFKITDCIFGKTNNKAADGVTDIVLKGFRFYADNDNPYLELLTTVFAPDFVLDGGLVEEINWDQKLYVEEDFDPQFADPENGNFTLPEESPLLTYSTEGGVIGDPRWEPISSVSNKALIHRKAFEIFPNPADQIIKIRADESGYLNIYSITGAKIKEIHIHKGLNIVNINNITAGLYLITSGPQNKIIEKLVVR